MYNVKPCVRPLRCFLYIIYHRLQHVKGAVYIGKNCQISKDLQAHEYVYIGTGCSIGPGVKLGAYTMLGPGVLFTGDDHLYDKPGVPIIFSGRPILRKTTIGKDVWIGTNSIIMAGVTIKDGSIIGAGAVVTKDIDECEIHIGIPNRKIKNRFNTDKEKQLHLEMINQPVSKGDFCGAKKMLD